MKFENKFETLFVKISSYFLISLPVLLITGSFLPDLVVSIFSITFLIYCFKNKIFKYFLNNFFIFFIFFWLFITTSSLLSEDIIFSLHSSLFYFRVGIFSLFVWYLLEKNSEFILKNLFFIFLLITIIMFIDSSFQYYNRTSLFGLKIQDENRVSSFFGDELIMGSFFSRFLPLIVGLFFYIKEKKLAEIKNYFFFPCFLMIITMIVMSGERTAFLLMIMTISLFLISNFRNFIKLVISVVILFLVINVLNINIGYRILTVTKNELFIKKNSVKEKINFFFGTHIAHYKSAYKMYIDNKIIGVGPRGFRLYCKDEKYLISDRSCSTHPHNTYLQLLSETGLIGFTFIFFLFLYLFISYFKIIIDKYLYNKKIDIFLISLIIMLLLTLWPIIPTGNFFHNRLMIIYYFPVGFYLWKKNKHKLIK